MEIPIDRLRTALQSGSILEAWMTVMDENCRKERLGGLWQLEVVPVGRVPIPSGRVMAGDPGMQFDMTDGAFSRSVPAGEYESVVSIALPYKRKKKFWSRRDESEATGYDPWVAYLTLILSAEPAVRFECAHFDNKGRGDRPTDQCEGFGVDMALAAIVDAETGSLLEGVQDPMSFVDHIGHAMGRRNDTRKLAAMVDLADYSKGCMAACRSGWGDGVYFSYWGLNASGKPVSLIVDFYNADEQE